MPMIHEMIESKFLKKEDLNQYGGEAAVTVTQIGQVNVAQDDQPQELKWAVFFTEFKKPLVLNSTNTQLLAKILGSENSDHWIGKRVVLYVDETVSFGGKIVGGLRVRALRRPAAALMNAPSQPMNAPRSQPMGAVNRQPGDDFEDDIPWQQ